MNRRKGLADEQVMARANLSAPTYAKFYQRQIRSQTAPARVPVVAAATRRSKRLMNARAGGVC